MNVSCRIGSLWRNAASLLAFPFLLFTTMECAAHYCANPVIRCKPGDIVTYYIISDRAEQGFSGFGILNQSDPSVAPVSYYTPVGRIYGLYVLQALQVGTNQVVASWTFPPNSASGICVFEVRVTTNNLTSTAANNPFSAFAGDPVNTYTGELILQEPPDLTLGGPMPLFFARSYASRLQADALVNSRMGNNWSHNFEWRALMGLTNQAVIVAPNGFNARFAKSGTNWVLQSPKFLPFQLVNSGANVIFGDPRDNRLYTFNTNGLLTSINDGAGNTHTLNYTESELLTQVSDGLGRTLTFEYVGPNALARVSDGTRSVYFQHLEIGTQINLVSAQNSIGGVTAYSYDNSKSVGSLLTSMTYPAGNPGYSQVYDDSGRVIQQTRLGTNVTRFAYGANGLTTVTNAAGAVSVYRHSPDGNFLSLTDPAGKVLTVTTNLQGLRAGISDRAGATVGIGYDAASLQPSAVTNSDGTTTVFFHTNRTINGITFRKLASVTLPDGSNEQFNYDAAGNLISHRDRAGNFLRMNYNSRGQILSVTNPAGGIVTTSYNADGTVATQFNSESGMVTFGYDSLRRPTNAVASDGRILRIAYDFADRILSFTDERTNSTFFGYDANHQLTSITNALGEVIRFSYDAADRLARVTDRAGKSVSYAYDRMDRVTSITNRNTNRIAMAWDARGRLASLADPAGASWGFDYDDENGLSSLVDPLLRATHIARDEGGFVSAITNSIGDTTSLTRDVMHRLKSAINPIGRLDQFKHDPRGLVTNTIFSAVGIARNEFNSLGLLSRLVDQNGSQWKFNYSPLGRLLNIVDPLNRTNSTSYDSRGRPQRFQFADGASQTNSYDAAGNLTRMDFSGGLAMTLSHDALHRVTNAANLALNYDAEGRVTNTVSSGTKFGAGFDAGGRMTNVSYNNGAFSVAYTYDSRDRLAQVRDSLANAQLNFYYDNAGQLTNVVRANGVNGIYNYDNAGQLVRIREGAFLDLQNTFDAAGQLISVNSTAPLSSAPPTAQTNVLTFDAAHQISKSGYAYDARGRLTAMPGHTLAWNAASQLVRVDGVTNSYNGAGNILTRATAAGTTRYHYNHSIYRAPIVAEQNAVTSQFLRYYVWTPDGQLLYMIDAANGNSVFYFHFDATGSTVALTSSAGNVTDAYSYTPYGVPVGRIGTSPQPFTYIGRYGVRSEPAANLYQMRARFYEPVSARFISRDPVWPRPSDPFSLNPYSYAANNPLRYLDSFGARPELANAATAITSIGREDIQRTGASSISDILETLPVVAPSSERTSGIYLRGLSANRTMVLLDGRRLPDQDLNTIPLSTVERVEVLSDGASSVYGSDAVAGVVNVITRPPRTEISYGTVSAALFDVKFSYNYTYTPVDSPPPAAPPQPIRSQPQLYLFQLAPEMMMTAAYGAGLQRQFGGSSFRDTVQALSLFGPFPMLLTPRGASFVNGQMVRSKPADLLYGVFMTNEAYDDLDFFGIGPYEIYLDFLDALEMGGSGGAWADFMGYRPTTLPPVF